MNVGKFLVKLAEARLQVGHVVGKSLNLSAHGVQARSGSGGEILSILLHRSHGGVELVDGIERLLDQGALHGGVLRDFRLHGLLALNQLIDARLKFDDLAGNSAGGRGAKQRAAHGSGEHGRSKK